MIGLVIRGRRVVTPEGTRPATVHVRDGVITAVTDWTDAPGAAAVDAADSVVMPGIVDTHVHVNEPGRTDWEGFETATRAAAAGGVTTILDMPLNAVPPTTSVAGLEAKRRAARGRCWVNVGFIGGLVPGNLADLGPLHDAGVLAFKCFLAPSGVDEFPHVAERDLRAAMPTVAALGTPLMVHAELPGYLAPAAAGSASGHRRYERYLASRPDAAETEAVALTARVAEESGARVHILHVSSAGTLAVLRDARERGTAITAETCPHYLTFAAGEIPDGATEFKCAPPIRNAAGRERLWEGLSEGAIDCVVSDHSPCPPALKCRETGDFFAAWGGISSLQLGLAAVWDGARARGVPVESLAAWMSAAPARLVGLGHRKGRLAAGFDADIVIWDPEAPIVVREDMLLHRHTLTPYLGRTLRGVVRATYVGGIAVHVDGRFAAAPGGRLLARGES